MGYMYYCPIQSGNGIGSVPSTHWHDVGNYDAVDLWGDSQRSPIYAIAGGVITYTYKDDYVEGNSSVYNRSTGNCIVYQITDDCDLQGAYVCCMHLSPVSIIPWTAGVEVGAKVNRGDLLGYTGDTGASDGFHLHLQIRYNSPWSDGTKIDWKPYTPEQGYRAGSQNDKSGSWGYCQQLFRNIRPVYKEITQEYSPEDTDVRWACTMAILEALGLGMIGMQETIGVVINRMNHPSFPNTIQAIISQLNQFSTYSANRVLFDYGGYTYDEIESRAPGLFQWCSDLLANKFTVADGNCWAAGYDGRITRVYYFRSDVLISNDYLYTRQNGGLHHYYNGINMWR